MIPYMSKKQNCHCVAIPNSLRVKAIWCVISKGGSNGSWFLVEGSLLLFWGGFCHNVFNYKPMKPWNGCNIWIKNQFVYYTEIKH